jgi:radical SAM protein with 4Fe4S-binding SPASM domain
MDTVEQYELIKGKADIPFSGIVAIEPTYRCNLSCPICFYEKRYRNPEELEVRDFIKFLDSISNLNAVYFPAVEPLMKKSFFNIVDYLKERGVFLLLLTNGTLINKDNFSKLTYSKKNTVMLSIDGDKNIHNKIRGVNSFDLVVQAAKLLKNRCDLRIVCVICEDNVNELWKMPKVIRGIGLNRITFEFERKYTDKDIKNSQRIIGNEDAFYMLRRSKQAKPTYSFKELVNSISKMEDEANKYDIKVDFLPSYFKEKIFDIYERKIREKNRLTCKYFNKIRIDPSGNFIHCFALRNYLGNIKKSSIEEVWNSEIYKNLRKKIVNNNLLPICETCWGATLIDDK